VPPTTWPSSPFGIACYEIDGYSSAPCGHRGRTRLSGPTSARSAPSNPSSPRSIRSSPPATRDARGCSSTCGSPAPAPPVRTWSVVPWLHPFQEMEPPEKPAAIHNRNNPIPRRNIAERVSGLLGGSGHRSYGRTRLTEVHFHTTPVAEARERTRTL